MDPTRLASVLGREIGKDDLRPAHVVGFKLMMWGPYPALTKADSETIITPGLVYQVRNAQEVANLQQYESANYGPQSCELHFEDGSKMMGETFVWRGEMKDLQEGSFHLEIWQNNVYGRNTMGGTKENGGR